MRDVTIDIGIGGTYFRTGAVAVDNSLSDFGKIPSGKFDGVNGASVLMDEVGRYMGRWKPGGNAKVVTVGILGTVSRDKTTAFSAPYVPSFTDFDLKHRLEDVQRIPVSIEKDANILIFGDMLFHRKDICPESDGMLVDPYYDSAVANAFYSRRQFYDGKNGAAEEAVHNLIRGLKERCVCGNIGHQCLHCEGKYLERFATERHPDTAFRQLFLAHEQEVSIRESAKGMAAPMTGTANILDPELIFTVGGMTDMVGFPWRLPEQYIRENTRHPMPADSLRFIFTIHSRGSGVSGVGLCGAYRSGLVELWRREVGMRDLFAPSTIHGGLLNLEEEIRMYERMGADMTRFDTMDTTFINITILPPLLLPAIHRTTRLPTGAHMMVDRPERSIKTFLLCYKDTYVSIHTESTEEIQSLLKAVKQAGGRPSVALNPGTPLCIAEEVIPLVDMMLVSLCSAGSGSKQDIDKQLSRKLQRARMTLEQYEESGALSEVDGDVSLESARRTKGLGASVFVLGAASIYSDKGTIPENMGRLREYLENSRYKENN